MSRKLVKCSECAIKVHCPNAYGGVNRPACGSDVFEGVQKQSGEAPSQRLLKAAIALVRQSTGVYLSGGEREMCDDFLNTIEQRAAI